MLTIKAQHGHKKLDDNYRVMFGSGEIVTIAAIKADIMPVYEMFIGSRDFEFKIFVNWTKARYFSTTGGFVRCMFSYGEMYVQKYNSYNDFLQNFYHEFGHIYHHTTNNKDFYSRTAYGKEVFAEEFAAMCMGAKYSEDCATRYELYDGYKNKQIYHKP